MTMGRWRCGTSATAPGRSRLISTAMGLNKPPERRKKFFIAGAALTVFAGAMFLLILGLMA